MNGNQEHVSVESLERFERKSTAARRVGGGRNDETSP